MRGESRQYYSDRDSILFTISIHGLKIIPYQQVRPNKREVFHQPPQVDPLLPSCRWGGVRLPRLFVEIIEIQGTEWMDRDKQWDPGSMYIIYSVAKHYRGMYSRTPSRKLIIVGLFRRRDMVGPPTLRRNPKVYVELNRWNASKV